MSYQTQVPNYDTTTGAPLPAGWVRWVDPESDEFYYHNESTGETTWDDPTRWKVGLLFDRLRGGEQPKEAPLYRPRTIECAFAEYSAADENESDGDAPVTLRVYDVSFRGAGIPLSGISLSLSELAIPGSEVCGNAHASNQPRTHNSSDRFY